MNEINIEEVSTTYDIKLTYHSDLKCQNYDATIVGVELPGGLVALKPWGENGYGNGVFEFDHSDPDRVIAIARMLLSFAQMVKENNQKPIDTGDII